MGSIVLALASIFALLGLSIVALALARRPMATTTIYVAALVVSLLRSQCACRADRRPGSPATAAHRSP